MAFSSPPARLRAVLFDRDDTIAYTDPTVYEEAAGWIAARFGVGPREAGRALEEQWKERALTWWDLRTHEEEEAFWAAYGQELAGRLGLPESAAAELMAAYPYERYMKPVAEAREVLEALRAAGLRIGVLSNTLPSIDRTLEAVGLADLVDAAIATCLIGTHKPDPGAYHHALDALGVVAAETLFVDDKAENVMAAQALGMQGALIDLQGQAPEALHRLRDVLALALPGHR
ncbi:HAD family hydrolase [Deinococcus navajonensis]|uniref:HAD family hydrolase n=1 Tax=Deinococcus navajonensis TaxID=309884 RepID=A0ABV8XKP6_9DEIO